MRLKCDYEISGQGTLDLEVSELDDLTPEAAESWLMDGARLMVVEQGEYEIRLRPHYSPDDLREALTGERIAREGE